jgi:hypothetical protein
VHFSSSPLLAYDVHCSFTFLHIIFLIANVLCRVQNINFLFMQHSRSFVAYPRTFKYTHPPLFAGSYFVAVWQIPGVASRMQIHHSGPSMYRSIKIVRQIEQVFEPYRMMFKELEEEKKQLPSQSFCSRILSSSPSRASLPLHV